MSRDGSSSAFNDNVFHYVVLTQNGSVASAYLDGVLQFSAATNQMDVTLANNPGALVNLLLDNTVGGGQGEWSSGRIILARFSDGVMSASEAAALAPNPFGPG